MSLTQLVEWESLVRRYEKMKHVSLREFFSNETNRGEHFILEVAGLYCDFYP